MQEDTRKYGAQYDRDLAMCEPGLMHNDMTPVMPPTYEEYEARIEAESKAEAARRWPLKDGDTIVYLDGVKSVFGECYIEFGSPYCLKVKGERWIEYIYWGFNAELALECVAYPTAMRLLPGEKPPKDHIAAMAMIAREAKKHKWLENYKKWR